MRAFFTGLGLVLGASSCAVAPVAVELEPHHKTLFADETLRVLDVHVPVGSTTLDHRHEYDIATVCIECAVTRTRSPGEPWSDLRLREQEGVLVAEYSGRPAAHAVRNVDKKPYRLIGIENLGSQGRGSATKAVEGVPKITLSQEARAFRIYDIRLAPGDNVPAHTHTTPIVVVLAAGEATVNDAAGQAAQRFAQPGDWGLIPIGQSHAFSAADGVAAHLVEIEVR